MVLLGVSKTAGSFMSFQKPATPSFTKSLYSVPHHARVLAWVKSGKTAGPGHTGPTYTEPSGFLTNSSPAVPES